MPHSPKMGFMLCKCDHYVFNFCDHFADKACTVSSVPCIIWLLATQEPVAQIGHAVSSGLSGDNLHSGAECKFGGDSGICVRRTEGLHFTEAGMPSVLTVSGSEEASGLMVSMHPQEPAAFFPRDSVHWCTVPCGWFSLSCQTRLSTLQQQQQQQNARKQDSF